MSVSGRGAGGAEEGRAGRDWEGENGADGHRGGERGTRQETRRESSQHPSWQRGRAAQGVFTPGRVLAVS